MAESWAYALACGYKLSKRISKVGIVCGLGPVYKSELRLLLKPYFRLLLRYGPHFNSEVRFILWLQKISLLYTPWLNFAILRPFTSKADLKVTDSDPGVKIELRKSTLDGLKQGTRGALQDVLIYAKEWGFELSQVITPVHLWHGMEDKTVPAALAKFVESQLPNCTATYYPNDGHYLISNHMDEILKQMS